jgi:multidrug efflux pump subunit AcrA (membrane-fusion protein)
MPISNEPLLSEPVTVRAKQRKGHSMLYWVLFLGVTLVAGMLIFKYAWLPRRLEDKEVAQETKDRSHARPVVTVVKVVVTPFSHELSIPGTSLAYNEASIYARASGYLVKRLVDIGDHVKKGQLLAVIDAPDLDQQTAQAKSVLAQSQATLKQMDAQAHLAQLNWDRYKVLVAKGVFSKQDGDQQEANLGVALANVSAAQSTVQANRDNLQRQIVLQQYERVTAPFSGVVTARNVDVGALISAQGGVGTLSGPMGANGNNQGSSGSVSSAVTPSTGGSQGGALFTVASIDPLRILVSVPEIYAPYIHLNQSASLAFEQFPEQTFHGKVTRTSASIDPATRTLLVEVQAANSQARLMPGTYVVANFAPPAGLSGLFIPGEAIVIRGGKDMAAVLVNNRVQFRPIQLGRDYGDQTEVTGGLQPGDIVVRNVSDDIEENVEVEPRYRNEKADTPKRP